MRNWAKISEESRPPEGASIVDVAEQILSSASAGRDVQHYARLKELMGQRFLGPDEIKLALMVRDIGTIASLPNGLFEILDEPSPFSPSKKVSQDHRLLYVPVSFDGAANTVLKFKERAESAYREQDRIDLQGKPIFGAGENWYHTLAWAKSPITTEGFWVLIPDLVPADTCSIDFAAQSEVISKNYPQYHRNSAPVVIELLALQALFNGERLYADNMGWTDTTATGHFVNVGCFFWGGFGVSVDRPGACSGSLGAALCRTLRDEKVRLAI